ncbi:MAG: nucleotidyltransferase family protein [Myxococcota bacterium]
MKTIAVILAAGASERMGLPKALLALDGKSFVGALAHTFARAGCQVLVVAGRDGRLLRESRLQLEVVPNRRWRQGMFGSVRVGLRAALARGADVVLVHPVDAPRLRSATVRSLVKALRRADAAIPSYRGRTGHPLVLSHAAARAILSMRGVPHLEAAWGRLSAKVVPTRDAGVSLNVNTPAAYRALAGRSPTLAVGK